MTAPKKDEHDILHDRAKLFECLPTFEEIRELEFIRQEGKYNMITEFGKVIDLLKQYGFFSALEWLARCQSNRFAWPVAYSAAMKDHEEKYGPRSGWFDDDFKAWVKKAKIRALELEIDRLKNESK